MKQFLFFLILFIVPFYTNAQWGGIGSGNPYTGNENPTIKNNDPDLIFEHTSNNTGEASIGWRDSGGDEAFLSWDFSSNEFFFGTSFTDPNVSPMTLNLSGNMELRGGGNRGINFMDATVQDGFVRHSTSDLLLESNIDDVIIDGESEIRFNTNDNQKAMITNAGQLLIGTTTPKQKLTVENGRIAIETVTSGGIFSTNSTGVDVYEGSAAVGGLRYGSGGLIIAGSAPNSLGIANSNGGSAYISTSGGRLTVRENGRVGINDSRPSFDLDVNGDGNFTGELTAASDIKLKRDISSISQATETLNKLNPVTYEFRSEEFPDLKLSEGQRWGLIAQEVEAVLPDLVSSNGNAQHVNGKEMSIKSVNYIDLIPMLVKAIQEQSAEIALLKAKIEAK